MHEENPLSNLPAGVLNDAQIQALSGRGYIIAENFSESCVKQACYELRASTVVWDLGQPEEKRKCNIEQRGYFLLRPGGSATFITMEKIVLPSNVIARILAKGQLFSIGILPVCTYADPGFEGRLGIVLNNFSGRYVKIPSARPIAKIEFTVLPLAVDKPYRGQHGYESEFWPVPTTLFATDAEIRECGVSPGSMEEFRHVHGEGLAKLRRDLEYWSRLIWIEIAVVSLLSLCVLMVSGESSVGAAIVTSIVSTMLVHFCIRPVVSGAKRVLDALKT